MAIGRGYKGSSDGTLAVVSGCKVWDTTNNKTLLCEGPQDNVAQRTQKMYIESLPALEELDVDLLQQKPYPVWDSVPESTDHYKVAATVTKADGTQSTCDEDYEPENVAYGGGVDFSDFVAEQGDGSYVFEVRAYDVNNVLLAYGKSAPQDFCRVELQVALLDEGGNVIEDERDPASVMFTINYGSASSSYQLVQCGPSGATACLEATSEAGYLFKGFSIDYTDGSQAQVEQNPYDFTLTKGMVVTATFQRDTAEIPVTLHVGEGHEEYARQIVDALNVEYGDGSASVAQSGAEVVYSTLKAQTRHDVMNGLQGVLWDLDAQYGMPAPGYVLGAAESYASEEDYLADVEGDETPLGDSLDLYLLWNKVVTQVDITVDAPVCGTQIAMEGWSQSPSPNASLTEGSHARIARSYWKGEGNPPYFEGNIVGGTAYTANVSFVPEFGYSFGDALVVTANGAAVDASMRGGAFEADIPVIAVHSWEGDVCSGCSAEKRTIAYGANGGSGSMENVFVAFGSEFTLPSCGFTAPAGKVFAGWQVGDATAASREGATITVSDDVTIKAVWEDLPTTPTFKSCYLVLSGMIGVTFTMAMPQDFVVGNSRMDFEVCGKMTSVSMANLSPDSYGRYHFTCYINSVQMADTISAKFYYGENLSESVETTISVQDYIDYIEAHSSDYKDTLNLTKSINDYGYYAQLYLSEQNHWTLGEGGSHAKMGKAFEESYDYNAIKADVEQYAVYKALGESGVKVSYKLHLDSGTGISVRVAPESDDVSIQNVTGVFGGKTYQAEEQSDGSWIVRMDGISAHRLADGFVVTGKTNVDDFEAGVCALSYARTVFNGSSYNDAAKNAMAAFYKYYGAAESYKQAHPFQ